MGQNVIQILHIEDNPIEAALMRELVSVSIPEEHELEGVGCMADALSFLQKSRPDVILTDLSLPDVSGMETLRTLSPRAKGIPIIVLSGYDDEKTSLQALRAGAQDYLVKGEVSSHLLRHAVRYSMERKRLDEALETERNLVDSLLENIPDRVFFKDQNSRYLRINRAMAALIGVDDPFDAIGQSDHDFFSTEHADTARADEESVMESGQPLIGRVEREVLADGSYFWVLTTKMPLANAAGEIVGTFGISRDITQFKETEEELEKALNNNRRLAEDLKQMAHLAANELDSCLPSKTATKQAKRLQLASERLRQIAHLDRRTEHRESIDLPALFAEAAAKQDQAGTEMQFQFRPESFPGLVGNRELLSHLVVEIVRHFKPGDECIITANELPDTWEITVAGRGAVTSDTAFVREGELDTETGSDSPDANVLSLALCRKIAELHGGSLAVAVTTGTGVAFRFTLSN